MYGTDEDMTRRQWVVDGLKNAVGLMDVGKWRIGCKSAEVQNAGPGEDKRWKDTDRLNVQKCRSGQHAVSEMRILQSILNWGIYWRPLTLHLGT
jgi:hypothetical protein